LGALCCSEFWLMGVAVLVLMITVLLKPLAPPKGA
jgi:hypothetical protein